jgi:hypothetical protein
MRGDEFSPLSAPPAQLLPGHELPAVAAHSQTPMARRAVQGQAGHQVGRTLSIVPREKNPERKAFYQLAWHLGASQSDLAHLQAEDVDWPARIGTICAWEQGIERITELKELWESLWDANKAVAKAYGLNASDFEHILNSFPVFARKQSEFFEFVRGRLATWFQEEGKIVRLPGSEFLPGLEPLPPATPDIKVQKSAPEEFKRAVVFTWGVGRLHQQQIRATRLRVGKLIYFIEVEQRSGLFQNFLKQAAGPYDPTLRYKGPQDIAVHQQK